VGIMPVTKFKVFDHTGEYTFFQLERVALVFTQNGTAILAEYDHNHTITDGHLLGCGKLAEVLYHAFNEVAQETEPVTIRKEVNQ